MAANVTVSGAKLTGTIDVHSVLRERESRQNNRKGMGRRMQRNNLYKRKDNLQRIVTGTMTILCLALPLAACGKETENTVLQTETAVMTEAPETETRVAETVLPETEAETAITEEPETEPPVSEAPDPETFTGEWVDINSERCFMVITCEDGVNYDIEITWGHTASESAQWLFSGTYDAEEEGIVYSGKRLLVVYDEDGTRGETVNYDDGTGVIYIGRNGKLYWEDHKEDWGADCTFERNEFPETEEAEVYSVPFARDWYKTYTLFCNKDTGSVLEMAYLDGGYMDVIVDGVTICTFREDYYTDNADGAYIYDDEMSGSLLFYYPNDGNHVELLYNGINNRYDYIE